MASDLPEWMTVEQVAEQLQLKPDTLDKWRQRGIGPRAHKIGPKSWRYRREDFTGWLASRETVGTAGEGD